MKKKLSLLMMSLVLVGCAGGPIALPEPTSSGALLYAEKCSVCHALPHPKRNTAAEWQHLLALMEQRMAERNLTALSDTEREVLMAYLQNNAR